MTKESTAEVKEKRSSSLTLTLLLASGKVLVINVSADGDKEVEDAVHRIAFLWNRYGNEVIK